MKFELADNLEHNWNFPKPRPLVVSVNKIVYARHGRELMGLKSPVSVPTLCEDTIALITSRWQGRHCEVGSGGSLSAKIWADEQKYHIRPSLRVS